MLARVLVLLVLVGAIPTAHAGPTAWRTPVAMGAGAPKQKIVLFGEHPDVAMPACRCAVGTWKLARNGETARAFAGTLQAPHFNHERTRKPVRLTMQIRKTRDLMAVGAEYRKAVLAILRGSGTLVVREVEGGAWEVVGYAPAPVGDLFANNPHYRATAPAPGEPSPMPDAAKDARALADAINDYRASLGLPRVPWSRALAKVATAHVRDLNVNRPTSDTCNMHSWSKRGRWTACCYDSTKAAPKCMWNKPREIARFRGKGYEVAAFATGITPDRALELWKHSPQHHDMIANRASWKTSTWRSFAVAIDGDYAVAWFSETADR